MASDGGRVFTPRHRFIRYGRIAGVGDKSSNDRFWLQAVVRRIANYVRSTPSSGHSGAGAARHANLATNAPNVRFLPIPSAVHSRADAPGIIGDGRF